MSRFKLTDERIFFLFIFTNIRAKTNRFRVNSFGYFFFKKEKSIAETCIQPFISTGSQNV